MATSRCSFNSPNPDPNKKLKAVEQDTDSVSDFRNWAEIPRDVLVVIFKKIGMIGVLSSAEFVCSTWWKAAKEESGLWRRIHMGMDDEITDVTDDKKLEIMVKKVVDRSRGGLEEFWIVRFCNGVHLLYTGARARNLKSLRLVACENISDYGLVGALQNMKQLEELELTYCYIRETALEEIGRACPLLSRFKLKQVSRIELPGESKNEEAAIGISKTMHQLRYLQLYGGWISDKGVKAILEGCPNLETLDVRECYNVRLKKETRDLCTRLKKLIRPVEVLSEESEFASEAEREPPEDQYDEYENYFECDCCISPRSPVGGGGFEDPFIYYSYL